MTSSSGIKRTGAQIREMLGHPVLDADAHVVECQFALVDMLKEVAGPRIAGKFNSVLENISMHRWYHADEAARRDQRIGRPSFWHVPSRNTRDRATTMLPGLMRERLDEFGIDFAVVYTTLGLSFIGLGDEEMRRALCRALNKLNAETFRPYATRLTPVAIIPMGTPEEAVEELEYAVGTLGMKAATVASYVYRPIPKVARDLPEAARYARYIDYLALDSELDYDKVWQKCVDLKVVPTSHVGALGGVTHGSISNYTFNHAGSFAAGAHIFCRALILGGVPKRFPTLKFAFLEGGAGWASMLYNTLVERFEKRGGGEILRSLDPDRQDRAMMADLFRKYGGDILGPKAGQMGRDEGFMLNPPEDRAKVDDFAATGAGTARELADQFVNNFYFGCEGEDRATVMAFDRRLNHFGKQLNAIFSSDLGHWDVPDMAEVLGETYELLEEGLVSPEDFRKFVFTNAANMYTSMNPDFFKGTVIESQVAAELKRGAPGSPKLLELPARENKGAIDTIMSRASPLRFSGDPVDAALVDQIVAAGLKAPDHGRLRPWRFLLIQGDARKRFGEALAQSLQRRSDSATEAQMQGEREKPLRAPLIIVVAATPVEHKTIPAIEQVVSAAAATQNMLIAAHALGLGAFWRTGAAADDAGIKQALGLSPADTLVGFIYIGVVSAPGALRPPNPAGVLEEWTGS